MTIAMGAFSAGALVVCADTKIVAADGTTTYGKKVEVCQCANNGCIALVNASNDGNSATMLAREIVNRISPGMIVCEPPSRLVADIKTEMTQWRQGYGAGRPPDNQFILGVVSSGERYLYFCEPPNTVKRLRFNEPISVGQGGIAVDPLIPLVFNARIGSLRATLMRLSYLMYRAKKDQAMYCGGDTDAVVLTNGGLLVEVARKDMAVAEKNAEALDHVLQHCIGGLTVLASSPKQRKFATHLRKVYLEASKKILKEVTFPSLTPAGI